MQLSDQPEKNKFESIYILNLQIFSKIIFEISINQSIIFISQEKSNHQLVQETKYNITDNNSKIL